MSMCSFPAADAFSELSLLAQRKQLEGMAVELLASGQKVLGITFLNTFSAAI